MVRFDGVFKIGVCVMINDACCRDLDDIQLKALVLILEGMVLSCSQESDKFVHEPFHMP